MMRKFICVLFLLIFFPLTYADEPILVIDSKGHVERVWDLIFTGSGDRLISAGEDKVVRIWDVRSGELARTLRGQIGPGPEGKICAAALSPDGSLLAVGGFFDKPDGLNVGKIRIFDTSSSQIVRILKGHLDVTLDLQFSPDGSTLASSGSDCTVRIWDVKSGELIHTLGDHQDPVYSISFSPDGTKLVSACYDGMVRLWDVRRGDLIRRMKGHGGKVRVVSYSPDGTLIASGGFDGRVLLWDGRTGRFIREFARAKEGVNSPITALAFSPSGDLLAFSSYGRGVIIRAIKSGKDVAELPERYVMSLAISPDGKLIALGENSGRITIRSLPGGKLKMRFESVGILPSSLAWSYDGRKVAFGRSDGDLELYFDFDELSLEGISRSTDIRWIEPVTRWGEMSLEWGSGACQLDVFYRGHKSVSINTDPYVDGGITCFAFTPKGDVVVGAAFSLALYDGRTGGRIRRFIGHTGRITAVVPSPDGRFLASASTDRTVRIWNVERGELLLSLFVTKRRDWICWSSEGYYASSASGDRFIGWQVNRGRGNAAEYYYAHQFKGKFYRPDIVKLAFAEGSVEAAMRSKEAVVPAGGISSMLPPEVQILHPKDGAVLKSSPITLRLKIISRRGARLASTIMLFVNGRPVIGRDLKLTPTGVRSSKQVVEKEVPLVEGENVISAMVATGNSSSLPVSVTVTYLPENVLVKPTLYILAIGVSGYPRKEWRLNFADEDAKSFVRFFKGQEGKLYGKVEAKLLVESEATRDNILDGLEWLSRSATQRDVVMVFISGHGVQDERGNYYFFPHDGNLDHLLRSGVRWYDFQETLSSFPCKVILFVDTCHAGAVSGRKGVRMDDMIRDLVSEESGVVVMAASTGREVSVELPDRKHGAFTFALIEGLNGKADLNGDEAVYLTELDAYLTDRVKELTKGTQHPTTQKPTTIRSFPLASIDK
ncbi:caspase family protein [Candidatus Poribacteria bacterium]|nr:caspase family protein [Candidatus Poribacteria bacterium]